MKGDLDFFKSLINEEFRILKLKIFERTGENVLAKLKDIKEIKKGDFVSEEIDVDKKYLNEERCANVDLILLIFKLNSISYSLFNLGGTYKLAITKEEDLKDKGIVLEN